MAVLHIQKRRKVSFEGKHNEIKSKVLLLLYDLRYGEHGDDTGRPALWIYVCSGVPYSSLQSSLGRWTSWGYVSRYSAKGFDGQPCWHYRIAPKGKRWIEKVLNRYALDVASRYVEEMTHFRDLVRTLGRNPFGYSSVKELIKAVNEAQEDQVKNESGQNAIWI